MQPATTIQMQVGQSIHRHAQTKTSDCNQRSLTYRFWRHTLWPLSALVKVKESVSPRELNHFNQRRSVSITANLAPTYSLGEALNFMDDTATKLLKPGYIVASQEPRAGTVLSPGAWNGSPSRTGRAMSPRTNSKSSSSKG